MNTPTAWDLEILAEFNRSIDRMQNIIEGATADNMVRDTLGDSRPETVTSMKARIEEKKEACRAIRRQFPEYFAL